MNQRTTPVTWQQLGLFGPDVVQLTLRVGIVPSSDHCQFQVEAATAGGRDLIAMVSMPHRSLADAADGLSEAVAELAQLVHEYTGPFPTL